MEIGWVVASQKSCIRASQDSFLHSILPKKFLVNLINYGGILYDLAIGFYLALQTNPNDWFPHGFDL